MIKQTWMNNRELFIITIKGKEVFWKDRKMPTPTRMIPMDDKIRRQILMSRNKIDPAYIEQFKLTKEEQKEYNEAIKNNEDIEEKLSEICKKDCLKSGSILQKEEKI